MDLTNYAIDENGKLVLHSNATNNNYIVWGIGENGLMHGVGAFLSRHSYKEQGIDFSVINNPTYKEIEDYYKSLDKFWGSMGE